MLVELAVCTLAALACFWMWLKHAAATIKIDDYKKIGPVSKLSLVTKLSCLFNIPMPQLENSRLMFYPCLANDLELKSQQSMAAGDMLEYLNRAIRADTLIVAFSGGAVNKIGVPRIEFRRVLSRKGSMTASCDQLYVLDHTGMSFYSNLGDCNVDVGMETSSEKPLGATLKIVFAKYSRVVLVGNCMGATGALRCANMLPSANCTVLAFNPEIAPQVDSRLSFRLVSRLKPSFCHKLPYIIENAVAQSVARVFLHSSTWQAEYIQAQMLHGCDAEIWIKSSDCNGCCEAMKEARERGNTIGASGQKGEVKRVVRFVHQECNAHGMLADVLRPKGSLAVLLDEAVAHAHVAAGSECRP